MTAYDGAGNRTSVTARARYYDAAKGRFLQRDPLEFTEENNCGSLPNEESPGACQISRTYDTNLYE
jgi:hypothetical protein